MPAGTVGGFVSARCFTGKTAACSLTRLADGADGNRNGTDFGGGCYATIQRAADSQRGSACRCVFRSFAFGCLKSKGAIAESASNIKALFSPKVKAGCNPRVGVVLYCDYISVVVACPARIRAPVIAVG